MKKLFRWTIPWLALLAAAPAAAEPKERLAALMERNRDHFRQVVETAYFESVEKRLSAVDYQRIRQQADAISVIAVQAREEHSRGERFDELAQELEKHAQKATEAAAKEELPEINVQAGEMAEYCAECHNAFRWEETGKY